MIKSKNSKIITLLLIVPLFLFACKGPDGKFKLPGGDARKTPADPKKRVEQNIREGKGIRFNDVFSDKGGTFTFASSNELWRASLDIIDFMPLTSVNYSGGIIITDWFSNENSDEEMKIAVRFLSNEIRSDALKIIIHKKKCVSFNDCKINMIEN